MMIKLKTALFGYKKSDVRNYIDSLNEEHGEELEKLKKEHVSKMDELRAQMEDIRREDREESDRLRADITRLTQEKEAALHADSDTIARTLLDAQEHAQMLREKSDREAADRDAANYLILERQQSEIRTFDGKIRALLTHVSEILKEVSGALESRSERLSGTEAEIEDVKMTYPCHAEDKDSADETAGAQAAEPSEAADDAAGAEEAEPSDSAEKAACAEEAEPSDSAEEAASAEAAEPSDAAEEAACAEEAESSEAAEKAASAEASEPSDAAEEAASAEDTAESDAGASDIGQEQEQK